MAAFITVMLHVFETRAYGQHVVHGSIHSSKRTMSDSVAVTAPYDPHTVINLSHDHMSHRTGIPIHAGIE